MTKPEITKNEFFHEFTVKLCSSLDIRKAALQCSFLIKELIPYDSMSVALITDKPNTLKHMVNIHSDGDMQNGQFFTITPEGWENMQKHLKSNKVLLMYEEENKEYAESLIGYTKEILESYDISMPLVFQDQPLGFFAIRNKDKFTKDQVDFLSSIKEPFTHAVAAAIRFESEQKQQMQLFSVDTIFNRLKLLGNINTDKKLAQELNVHPSNIANCRLRNSIPYDKIIQYCHSESLTLDHIFMHEPFVLNKKSKNSLYKAVLTDGIKLLDSDGVEELLNLPKGELETYIETCADNYPIIPPVSKLSTKTLQTFQRTLLDKNLNSSAPPRCDQINIPLASGIISEDREVERINSLCFCKKWVQKLNLSDNIFAFNISGDIMAPTLIEGDTVIIDPDNKSPRSGGLYAISVGDSISIRRLVSIGDDSLAMICDNKIYPTGTLTQKDIIGKVVWYARNL